VVIAVLLLLPLAGYEVPWDADPRDLVEQLQPPGVSAIARDGRGASARDGRSDAMARYADRIRKTIREEAGAARIEDLVQRGPAAPVWHPLGARGARACGWTEL
jgi:hypothetical protein